LLNRVWAPSKEGDEYEEPEEWLRGAVSKDVTNFSRGAYDDPDEKDGDPTDLKDRERQVKKPGYEVGLPH
jgi:hypothetical protein